MGRGETTTTKKGAKTMTIAELRQQFDMKVAELGDNDTSVVSFCIDTSLLLNSVPYFQEDADRKEFSLHIRRIQGDSAINKYTKHWNV